MRRMNVWFPEQNDEQKFVADWLDHRKFSVPRIHSALGGRLEFLDSSLMKGTDKDGKIIYASDAYWPERQDFDDFWTTKGGEEVMGNLKGYWPNFGRWRGLLPADTKVIAGVERPVEAVYGLDAVLASFPGFAMELISRPEKPWQVELFSQRVMSAKFQGIVVVTLANQTVWEESQNSLAEQLLSHAGTEFMGTLRTPELEDLDYNSYERVFSQTQRGVRKALPAEVG